jgi:hypothetical protein
MMIRFANWFRVTWWIILCAAVTVILWTRFGALSSGNAVSADVFVFLIWIALLLVPVFSEISLFGIGLKQEIKDLSDQVTHLQTEIRNSVDVRAQINPVFYATPPADSQLPALEQRLKAMLAEVLREAGVERVAPTPSTDELPQGVDFLFKARYQLERELRRIWRNRTGGDDERRPLPIIQIARFLAQDGLLDPRVLNAVREVYAVASPAVHGEPVSEAKLAFVRDVAPQLIATLKAIT